MLREYVISEAMHALGIPTTRALAVIATGRTVERERPLPGAILTRVAASHLRVGTFEYARALDDRDLLQRLTAHAIDRHHPAAADAENPALALLAAVSAAQARLVAQWMLVGFIHGVMNTDNMTISGETIDYGPCAFLDAFDPATVFSSIDVGGRYRFGNQPGIAQWNLARLAEALLPLIDDDDARAVELAQDCLGDYATDFAAAWNAGMRAKLGLPAEVDDDGAAALAQDLPGLLQTHAADHTGTFRALADVARGAVLPEEILPPAEEVTAWTRRWLAFAPNPDAMDRVNPVYIPRNHLVEEALDAAVAGDLEPFHRLLAAVTAPYEARPGFERFARPAPADAGPYRTFCGT